jgi:hypothetical protein
MRRFTTEPQIDADLRECYRRLCLSKGEKLILILRPLEFEHPTSTTVIFPKDPLSNIMLGAAGCHIPESKPTRNTSKNTIRLVPKIMLYLRRLSNGCQREI